MKPCGSRDFSGEIWVAVLKILRTTDLNNNISYYIAFVNDLLCISVLEVHNQLLVPTLGMTDYYILCPMNGYKLIKRINDKMNEIKYHTSNEKSLKGSYCYSLNTLCIRQELFIVYFSEKSWKKSLRPLPT